MPNLKKGQDAWSMKYPLKPPHKVRVENVTEASAKLAPYRDDGTVDARVHVLEVVNMAGLGARVFADEASAAEAWNGWCRADLDRASREYAARAAGISSKLLPVPGAGETGGNARVWAAVVRSGAVRDVQVCAADDTDPLSPNWTDWEDAEAFVGIYTGTEPEARAKAAAFAEVVPGNIRLVDVSDPGRDGR